MRTFGKAPERRQLERMTGCLQATIELPCRNPIACVVENISVGGALIVPQGPVWLPPVFKLVIAATRFATYCEVRHREPTKVGVAFVSQPVRDAAEEWNMRPDPRGLSANAALRQRLGVSRH